MIDEIYKNLKMILLNKNIIIDLKGKIEKMENNKKLLQPFLREKKLSK